MADTHLPPLDDLRTLRAEIERTRRPLLVLFTSPGCPYCLIVRRNYLAPRLRDERGPIVREVDITGARRVTGLDGQAMAESAFASRYRATMTPVVLLLGADFRPLAEPLVGVPSADFYEAYLAARIDEATRRLAR